MAQARPAVFLDRDGTINVRAARHDYVRDPNDFRWLPGALEGMVRLARAGRPLIVVSNQRGVSRGLVSCATLSTIESRIQEALAEHSCHVEAFKYCVHDLDTRCDCRKPRPGLLVSAAAEMGLDLRRSWMVGDTDEDMEAGSSAGCRTILLTTDMGRNRLTAESLSDAAAAILAAGPADVPDDHAYAR